MQHGSPVSLRLVGTDSDRHSQLHSASGSGYTVSSFLPAPACALKAISVPMPAVFALSSHAGARRAGRYPSTSARAPNPHTSRCPLRGIRPPFRTLNACQNLLRPRLARRARTVTADAIRRIRGDPWAVMPVDRVRQPAVNHMRVPALRRPHLRAASGAPLTRSQPLSEAFARPFVHLMRVRICFALASLAAPEP